MDNLYNEYINSARGMLYLATSENNQPSVRGVGFSKSDTNDNVFYIVTQPTSAKVAEIKANSNAAFTTPIDMATGMRMGSNRATIKVSDKKWEDVAHLFTNPGWHNGHPHPENEIVLELSFPSVVVQSYAQEQLEIAF
ncbi:MAG: pyridoxamine 5'-phosphate oxidase family protein [Lactobacillaceae bacterium]|nr:pyridoxamine 5'-phosphate oxidase family protein [Lactobacillaceae bacterium]